MMISFCKKSVHSILGLANHPPPPMINTMDDFNSSTSIGICRTQQYFPEGLGLVISTSSSEDVHRKTSSNILESASVKSSSSSPSSTPPSSPLPSSSSSSSQKDPGGIGFLDDVGGGVDGLMSCTESLGFESSDERRVDDELDELCSRERISSSSSSISTMNNKAKWRKEGGRREVKKFPPPLSSLNHNGQPSFFLRPVRRDGRLELTEVRLDRPEILRASRQDGRLTLHLIRNEEFGFHYHDGDEEEEEEVEDQEQEEVLEAEKETQEEEEYTQNVDEKEGEEEEEEMKEEWGFGVKGEGFRRCNDMVVPPHHHHDYHSNHHNLHVWSQHCVTTR